MYAQVLENCHCLQSKMTSLERAWVSPTLYITWCYHTCIRESSEFIGIYTIYCKTFEEKNLMVFMIFHLTVKLFLQIIILFISNTTKVFPWITIFLTNCEGFTPQNYCYIWYITAHPYTVPVTMTTTVYAQMFKVCKFQGCHKYSILVDHQPFEWLKILWVFLTKLISHMTWLRVSHITSSDTKSRSLHLMYQTCIPKDDIIIGAIMN